MKLFTTAVVLGLMYTLTIGRAGGDVVGDNDNGSPSPGGDNGFEVRQLNNIEPRDVASVGNVGGGHAINTSDQKSESLSLNID